MLQPMIQIWCSELRAGDRGQVACTAVAARGSGQHAAGEVYSSGRCNSAEAFCQVNVLCTTPKTQEYSFTHCRARCRRCRPRCRRRLCERRPSRSSIEVPPTHVNDCAELAKQKAVHEETCAAQGITSAAVQGILRLSRCAFCIGPLGGCQGHAEPAGLRRDVQLPRKRRRRAGGI